MKEYVLLTGASSGIGLELAAICAQLPALASVDVSMSLRRGRCKQRQQRYG